MPLVERITWKLACTGTRSMSFAQKAIIPATALYPSLQISGTAPTIRDQLINGEPVLTLRTGGEFCGGFKDSQTRYSHQSSNSGSLFTNYMILFVSMPRHWTWDSLLRRWSHEVFEELGKWEQEWEKDNERYVNEQSPVVSNWSSFPWHVPLTLWIISYLELCQEG
jgi:hypothetical protein